MKEMVHFVGIPEAELGFTYFALHRVEQVSSCRRLAANTMLGLLILIAPPLAPLSGLRFQDDTWMCRNPAGSDNHGLASHCQTLLSQACQDGIGLYHQQAWLACFVNRHGSHMPLLPLEAGHEPAVTSVGTCV